MTVVWQSGEGGREGSSPLPPLSHSSFTLQRITLRQEEAKRAELEMEMSAIVNRMVSAPTDCLAIGSYLAYRTLAILHWGAVKEWEGREEGERVGEGDVWQRVKERESI